MHPGKHRQEKTMLKDASANTILQARKIRQQSSLDAGAQSMKQLQPHEVNSSEHSLGLLLSLFGIHLLKLPFLKSHRITPLQLNQVLREVYEVLPIPYFSHLVHLCFLVKTIPSSTALLDATRQIHISDPQSVIIHSAQKPIGLCHVV